MTVLDARESTSSGTPDYLRGISVLLLEGTRKCPCPRKTGGVSRGFRSWNRSFSRLRFAPPVGSFPELIYLPQMHAPRYELAEIDSISGGLVLVWLVGKKLSRRARKMVVLMESPGLTLKRKGAEEPGLFMCPGDGDGEGFTLSCRATKIRRLGSADHQGDVPTPPAVAGVGTGGDVMMGEAPSLAVADEERAVTVYDPAARGPLGLPTRWRLRPWAPLRAGAEWIRDMLREADFRTVREMLTGAHGEGAGMAVVPWGAAPAPPSTEASTAAETVDGEDAEETAKMDVEEDRGHQTQPSGAGCGEGYFYRWPQHCMAPPQLPAVGQASPVMWSW